MYAIRIDDRQDYIEKIKELENNERLTKILCVKHKGVKGENIHYHLAVNTDYKNQALRKELKKQFDKGKGNGHMSLKEWDGNKKALSYMFHEEEAGIIIMKDYNNNDIEEFKRTNNDIQKSLKENGTNAIVSKVVGRAAESGKWRHSHEDICFLIWDILKENGEWFPNKYQLERWVMKVQAELQGQTEYEWSKCKKEWYRQMFQNI